MSCPSCGAPLPTRNPGIVVTVCEHCDSVVTWDADAARDSGKKSRLPQGFTRLYTGATGTLEGTRFVVMGRVRYGYDRGFWDEWLLRLDAPDGQLEMWLTEDDHELAAELERGRQVLPSTPPGGFRPGQTIPIGEHVFVVEEVGHAECIGLEGQLPESFELGETYDYVDGSTADGAHTVGIEFDEDQPMVYVGEWIDHDALELDDAGDQW